MHGALSSKVAFSGQVLSRQECFQEEREGMRLQRELDEAEG